MPKPISPAEASAPRIVIVTMDSHFGGAVDKARAMLRQQIPGLELTLHAADEFAGAAGAGAAVWACTLFRYSVISSSASLDMLGAR